MKLSGGSTRSDKSVSGKTMAGDDKKIKTNPTSKNEVPSKDKSGSGVDTSKAEGGQIADASPSGYSRGEGQKPVSKAYKDNWNAIFAKNKTIIRRLLLPASLIYFCSAKPTDACLASAQRQHRLSRIFWNRQARRPYELLTQLSNLGTTPKRVEHPDLRGCGTRKKARKNPGPSSFPVEGGISSPYRPCHPFHRQAYRAPHFPSSAFRRPWLPW